MRICTSAAFIQVHDKDTDMGGSSWRQKKRPHIPVTLLYPVEIPVFYRSSTAHVNTPISTSGPPSLPPHLPQHPLQTPPSSPPHPSTGVYIYVSLSFFLNIFSDLLSSYLSLSPGSPSLAPSPSPSMAPLSFSPVLSAFLSPPSHSSSPL